jgi:hypothetical protein
MTSSKGFIMISFNDYLSEAGTSPLNIVWETKGKSSKGYFIALFGEEKQKFDIDVSVLDNCNGIDIIQFKFFKDNSTKLANENKYMFQVLATVRDALYTYVNYFKPEMLLFASSDNSSSRKAIYKLESARLATKFNYFDVSKLDGLKDTDILFGIYKDKKYTNCIEELTGIKFN